MLFLDPESEHMEKERKKEYNEREKHTTRFMIFNWCDPLLLAKPLNPYPT